MKKISIYDYTDYPTFIGAYYEEKKKEHSFFSYQFFANKAGFRSKTFIYKVITGEKSLAPKSVLALARAMGLSRKETEYFDAMVNFNNAKTVFDREYHFNHLQSFCRNHKTKKIREDQYSYFAQWYHPVIRELVTMINFGDDSAVLARLLNPRITPRQAQESISLLLRLELIEKTAGGKYRQTEKWINTGNYMKTLAIHSFQKENMRLAGEALDRFDKDSRDISTITGALSEKAFQKIKEEINDFRKYIGGIIDEDEGADRVCQINFHLFPLTQIKK